MSDKSDPWYQPPTIYYRGEERFGTPEQMIDEITRLRAENTVAFNKGQNAALKIIAEHLGIEPGCSHARVKEAITRLRERCEALEALVRRASTDSTTSLGGPGCFFCDRDDTDIFANHAADCPVRKVVKEPDHAD